MTMRITSAGLDLIKRFEGFRSNAYRDAVGIWTIGYGHTDAAIVVQALAQVGYGGYLSAEVFPLPDADATAHQALQSFRKFAR